MSITRGVSTEPRDPTPQCGIQYPCVSQLQPPPGLLGDGQQL